jgi:ribosomal protein S27E
MGEALDQAKQKLGLANGGAGGQGAKPPGGALAELEAAISTVENIDARELLQAKARLLRAEMDLKTREAEARGREYETGGRGKEPQNGDKKKDELVTNALVLIDKGVDPKVVAQYILASSSANPTVTFGAAQQQGITLTDILALFDRMNASKGTSPEMQALLAKLTDDVAALKARTMATGQPKDAMTLAKEQAEGIKALVGALVETGLVRPPGGGGESTGEPLDVIKEKNRHEERRIELGTEKEYKAGMVDAVGNLAEDIGRGAASQVLQRKEVPREKTGGVLETFECRECHATIYVTPETGDKVKCAKCGMVYERPKA